MKNVILTLGIGALAIWYAKKTPAAALPLPEPAQPGSTLVTKNGHTWLIEPSASGSNVFAPAGSWGPHQKLLVLRFREEGTPAMRILSGVGANVPLAMRDAALADLSIAVPKA